MKMIDTQGRLVLASEARTGYGTSTAITCTLASLAQGSARQSAYIDNTSNKFLDAIIYLKIKLQNTTPGSDKAIYVWFYGGSEDGALWGYTDNATGSDAALTMRSPSNLRGPFVIVTPDTGGLEYKAVIGSVAAFFGGVLPKRWGIVVENKTNVTFSATTNPEDHVKTYTGVYSAS